jgi:hypothetical protein
VHLRCSHWPDDPPAARAAGFSAHSPISALFPLCFLLPFVLVQITKRNIDLLFVRGDAVILISPPLRMA